uniref:M23 family metallopeptidase n=1 Tax=Acinetobacter sp. TUM15509 TaxID=2609154 RepID=UPI00125E1F33
GASGASGASGVSGALETRIESGLPAATVAVVYSEENLYLHPDNEKYRKIIINAAKKYNLAPQALAAKINAEAGTKRGSQEWNADARASTSSAVGLTQFLSGTWYEICTRSTFSDTLLQQHVVKKKLISNFKENMDVDLISNADKAKLKALGTDPTFSVDSAAAYARANIDTVKKTYSKIDSLEPSDLAKIGYVAHHDGPTGFGKIVEATNDSSWSKLQGQVCPRDNPNCKTFLNYKERFNNGRDAYRWWLCTEYTDAKINLNRFTLSPADGKKFKNARTMEEIIIFLGGKALVHPSKDFEKKKGTNDAQTIENISIIITSIVNNKVEPNIQYSVKSKYGLKPHSTNADGHEVIQIKKGDKLEIIFENQVLTSITSIKDKEEFRINFPSAKGNNIQNKTQEVTVNNEKKLNFNGWRNPLAGICQVRRFGYNSLPLKANAATYNTSNLQQATQVASRFNRTSYRSSGMHQGIDLEADNGVNVYPVCVGTIAKVIPSYPGYGKTIILECDVNDLPASKRALAKNIDTIYFIYAHLNSIDVAEGVSITALDTVLGKTGNTGNAGSMTKIEGGSHLHFEVRTEISKSMGKSGMSYRLDPFPWLDNCMTVENGVKLNR